MVAELVHYTDDGMRLDEAIAAYLAACDVEGKSPRTAPPAARVTSCTRTSSVCASSSRTGGPAASLDDMAVSPRTQDTLRHTGRRLARHVGPIGAPPAR